MISEHQFQLEVGRRLRKFREALGRSQQDFGDKLGVGKTAISNYEKGDRLIDPYLAMKLKIAYSLPLEWLYTADELALPKHLIAAMQDAVDQKRTRGRPRKKAAA